MGEKTFPAHYETMRYRPPQVDGQTKAAMMDFTRRMYRAAGLTVQRKEPKIDPKLLEWISTPIRIDDHHSAELSQVLDLATWLIREHLHPPLPLAPIPGVETRAVRLLQGLQRTLATEIEASVRDVLELEAVAALHWLSMATKKQHAELWLTQKLKPNAKKAAGSTFEKWLNKAAQKFYSDPNLPIEMRAMKGRSLTEIPESMRFTPEWLGDCWYCSQLLFRGKEYCINMWAWTVPSALRDLCPERVQSIDAMAALSELDSFRETAEAEGWRSWPDKRVSDESRRTAFRDVCWRILEPLALAA